MLEIMDTVHDHGRFCRIQDIAPVRSISIVFQHKRISQAPNIGEDTDHPHVCAVSHSLFTVSVQDFMFT
jgi:hypothetical protein